MTETRMGGTGWTAAILWAPGTAAFIPAFKHTSIANVSLIYATAPFVALSVAYLWYREVPRLRVIVASIFALIGAVTIVGSSIGQLHLKGDLMALWMTIMMSTVMVVYRRYPGTPAVGPTVLASLFLLPVALYLTDPFAAPGKEIFVMALFGLIFAIASVTLQAGARRLPSGEASLISALETPLAPIWTLLLFAEVPATSTIIGGTIILLAVFSTRMKMRKKIANTP